MRRTRLSSAWKKAGHQVTSNPTDVQPDLIVIDLSFASSIEIIRKDIEQFPDIKVIAFGPHTDGDALKKAAQAGASKTVSQGSIVEYVLGL